MDDPLDFRQERIAFYLATIEIDRALVWRIKIKSMIRIKNNRSRAKPVNGYQFLIKSLVIAFLFAGKRLGSITDCWCRH